MSILGIILGLLPGFVWLLFYLEEDPRPEPKRLLAFTFLMGGVSTAFALAMQIFLRDSNILNVINPLNMDASSAFIPLILLAGTEEIVKFGAAYLAVRKARDFDEPIDAMIYAIVAALGFATVENIAVLQGQFSESTMIFNIIGVTTGRFVGATLLHTLTAAFMGYYWALSKRDGGNPRFIWIGLLVATVIHAGFNFLILNHENIVYALLLLVFVGFFVIQDFEELKKRRV